ncbi:MAG: alpha/beta fold hydrolase, partial [Gemmatimonadales bacterium]
MYTLDYPGHGHSDIPRAEYSPDFFVRHVAGFLDRLELSGVTLVGESIGAASPCFWRRGDTRGCVRSSRSIPMTTTPGAASAGPRRWPTS